MLNKGEFSDLLSENLTRNDQDGERDSGNGMDMAEDHVQWFSSVSVILNLQFLLPESLLIM
jgi:hypothetical protein